MKATAALVAATLLLAVTLLHRAEANPISRSCEGANCVVDLTRCEYGEVTDFFGRKVCAKGPGEKCGEFTKCGAGLFCENNKCAGCSLGPGERCGDFEKCGAGMMCKQKLCNGCSLVTLQCFTFVDLPISEED